MKKQFRLCLLGLGSLMFSAPLAAQISLVSPVPHEVTDRGDVTSVPTGFRLTCDDARRESFALNPLAAKPSTLSLLPPYEIVCGVAGDKCIKPFAKFIPRQKEGYYLKIEAGRAIVAGRDEQGLYYGLQTLLQSISKGKAEACTVRDWPDVAFRGTVEGFYGTPWSHANRLEQLRFYGRNKMNVYIYGPKDDPFHRARWREPYPEAEAALIRELAEEARRNGVNFYWAIHPGVDIKWTDADRDALMAKFEKMYALGVRAFAVFFDDIWGEGTRADKQAELLNYIDDHFIKTKKDVSPLVMCPTEYNRAWANDGKGYLRTLGTKMNKSVEIMWTGNSVVHCIDAESMDWINSRIDRRAYIWWNFPVTDYVRDHLMLGPVYGNGLDIAPKVSGFVSNPMEFAEASKIALYALADYTWNMQAYDEQASWLRALADLLPAERKQLEKFASYNEDAGPNGHGFRRDESRQLSGVAEAAAGGDRQALAALYGECVELGQACDILLGSDENPELIEELRPWLIQGTLAARYGQTVVAMALGSAKTDVTAASFENLYNQARSVRRQMTLLEYSDIRHPLQTGIKVGSRVLMPTLSKIFASAVNKHNADCGTKLDPEAEFKPYKLSSGVPQLAGQSISAPGSDITIAPVLEVVDWPAGASLTLSSSLPLTLDGMDFDFGVPGQAGNFTLELELTDGTLRPVGLLHYKEGDTIIHTDASLSGATVKSLRLTNTSGKAQKIYFKKFRLGHK